MSNKNNWIFYSLHIVAWLIFVGLCIEAGGLVVNFIFSILKPEFVDNLYQKLDLGAMYHFNKGVFFGVYGFILTTSILKAYLFYLVIMLLSKINMVKPFSSEVAKQITQISYLTFSIGIISFVARKVTDNLPIDQFDTASLHHFWVDSQAFILMAAVVYVIATIFTKGVEIQNENDLTV
jgi:hypothetical protein